MAMFLSCVRFGPCRANTEEELGICVLTCIWSHGWNHVVLGGRLDGRRYASMGLSPRRAQVRRQDAPCLAPERPDGYASYSDHHWYSQSDRRYYLLLWDYDRERWWSLKLGLHPRTRDQRSEQSSLVAMGGKQLSLHGGRAI